MLPAAATKIKVAAKWGTSIAFHFNIYRINIYLNISYSQTTRLESKSGLEKKKDM